MSKARGVRVKHVPMRTCIATGNKFAKRDLVRIVRTADGAIAVDDTGKLAGSRGAYVSKQLTAIQLALKHKKLEAEFEQPLSAQDVEVLLDYFQRFK